MNLRFSNLLAVALAWIVPGIAPLHAESPSARPRVELDIPIFAGGYGDGFSRFIPSGTPVLVNGRRVPVAGRISMDLTAVDLGPEATDAIGDPVVFWGDDLPVEEIAEAAGTIPYQLLTGVTHREPAVYE